MPRRLRFVVGLGFLVLGSMIVGMGGVEKAYARARDTLFVTAVAQNDGNTASLLTVSCSNSAWTSVAAANPRRRRLRLDVVATATGVGVCLSSTSVSGDTCSDARAGFELLPSTPAGHVDLRDEDPWYCRARSGGVGLLKGAEFYDSRDETAE